MFRPAPRPIQPPVQCIWRALCWTWSGWDVRLTTPLHPVPSLQMSEAVCTSTVVCLHGVNSDNFTFLDMWWGILVYKLTVLFCRQFEVLCMGVASLHAFVQSNWTGPPLESDPTSSSSLILWLQSWYECSSMNKKQLQDEVMACLVLDGESCCPVMSHPELLLLSRVCLRVCCDRPKPLPVSIIFVSLVQFVLR